MWSNSTIRVAFSAALLSLLFVFTGCSDDTASATSCTSDASCALGSVCGANSTCVQASCDFCTAEQVCYKTPENPNGTCSAPECSKDEECADKGGTCRGGLCSDQACSTNADCGANQTCSLAGECVDSDGTCTENIDCPSGQVCSNGACAPGCSSNDDCDATEYCADSVCETGCRDNTGCGSNQVCTEGQCRCTIDGCGDGKFCDTTTGECTAATNCGEVTCPTGMVCNDVDLSCIAACTADSCNANEVCTAEGRCEVSNCPGEDPTQCADNVQRPNWDPIKCFCAECLSDNDCNVAGGEVCNSGGKCFSCQTACAADQPGTCMGDTPYCIDSCCLECIGAADCAQGQLCLDGFCGTPPNCSVDPSVCPVGYECDNATGSCKQPNGGGGACDLADPNSCPAGTFCDPTSMTCGGLGGAGNPFACGFCNADCTCDGGLACDGLFCGPCDPLKDLIGQSDCGSGTCLPGLNICLPQL